MSNMNLNCTTDSAANLLVCGNRSSHKSKESTRKPSMNLKELFHRDLNKNIIKLCTEGDLRIKVLLSNKESGVISSSSKLSSKDSTSSHGPISTSPSLLKTFTRSSLLDTKLSSFGTSSKTISFNTSKHSLGRLPKPKSPCLQSMNSSCHFNSKIDNNDDPTNKQLTVLKILRLKDVARRLEKRQNKLMRRKFESSSFEKSYTDGLEEGIRYGYFNNPNEEPNTETEKTEKSDASTSNEDPMKNNKVEEAPEKKESERMRGGFQDPQQQKIHLKNKISTKSSGITITNEFPGKCDEDVNVEAFNEKYRISKTQFKNTQKAGVSENDLNADKGDKYLKYYEKMLSPLGEDFAKGFKAGFGDGFMAANMFVSNDTTFSEDEREYIIQMRKCLKLSEVSLENDVKKIRECADELKNKLNIADDEFEEISRSLDEGMVKKNILTFSKNDQKHYIDAFIRDRENFKIKSSGGEESDVAFTSSEGGRYILQHTKNRAKKYLIKHRINEFFQFLGSHLVATKPDDPISFLIGILDKCIEYRLNEYVVPAPLLFTKKHIESVYFVLDPLGTGFIDLNQYIHGMEALGLGDLEHLSNFRPGEKIDRYIFVTHACRRLLCKFRAMIALDS